MSVPLPGWFAALQGEPIDRQLADGIRGLLIDTHYADRLANGRTRTYFGGDEAMQRQITQDGVSQASVEAALRLRDRLGFRGSGERGMYLCHTFCELGSTPLADVLDQIRDFLVTHPGDVLVVINQDYVTPADFVGALDRAGLARLRAPAAGARRVLAHAARDDRRRTGGCSCWPRTTPAPRRGTSPSTSGWSRRRRSASRGPGSSRTRRAWTRAAARTAARATRRCSWSTTGSTPTRCRCPSNADVVNAYAPLLARARACERDRGAQPVNLLAVDFYERGDLFKVIDTLNGVQG